MSEAQAAQGVVATVEAPPKHDIILSPHRRQGAEFAVNVHVVTADAEHTKEDIVKPIYWAHTATQFKPYDEIKVRSDDGRYWGHLLVLACDRTWAKVHVLSWHALTTSDVSLSQAETDTESDFYLKYLGIHRKWGIVRRADASVVREGEQTKQNAQLWLDEYLKVINT